jgi:hypothetical protein
VRRAVVALDVVLDAVVWIWFRTLVARCATYVRR